jgi:hypothetical protein
MKLFLAILASIVLASLTVFAQKSTLQDPQLDHMVGRWVLQGTIAGSETTHDIIVEWVLGHQYIRLNEVSREKNAQGQPAYQAIVFIGWDQESSRYACLWLDSTGGGGLSAQAIGYAKPDGDSLAFVFKGKDGSIFHTTFVYNKGSDTWQWLMDGEESGKLVPFARVKLTKKK